jgi:hypothetical protein
MKTTVHHLGFGTIDYEESFWTGARTLVQNGKKLEKRGKNEYLLSDGEREHRATLKGGLFAGVYLETEDGERIAFTPALAWYEIVFAVVILAFMVVWGNSVKLCSIIPVLGGALGGGITGVCIALGILFSKKTERAAIKLLIWLGVLVAAFLTCAILGVLATALLAAL